MKITKETAEWLNENTYAFKKGDWYFLPDFPKDQVPERLEIPVNKKSWQMTKDLLSES